MTTAELAAEIGISRVTLSKYLNGRGGVSEETAQRIEKHIQQSNFAPNSSARHLAGKKEPIIGFFSLYTTVAEGESRISSHFSTEFTNCFLVAAKTHGYKVLVSISSQEEVVGEVARFFSSGLIRGAVLFGCENGTKLRYSADCPMVLINQEETIPGPGVSLVNMADEESAAFAFEELLSKGHRRFLYIGSALKRLPSMRRRRGVLSAYERSKALVESFDTFDADFSEDISYKKTLGFYQGRKDYPTAVIAANDLSAIGAIRALGTLGIRVPGDVSVIGFDDISVSSYFNPPLTTFSDNTPLLAGKTMEEMLALFQGSGGRDIEVPMEYKSRDSVAEAGL